MEHRNILNKIIKNAQKDYYQNLIKQHNNSCIGLWKKTGKYYQQKINKHTAINNLKTGSIIINDPVKIANTTNDFFLI